MFRFFSRCNENNLLPLRVSKYQSIFVMNLLLLNNMGIHHYVVIKNRNKLVSKIQKRKLRNMLCRNCFHRCSSEDRLERHQLFCMRNEPAIVFFFGFCVVEGGDSEKQSYEHSRVWKTQSQQFSPCSRRSWKPATGFFFTSSRSRRDE